MKKGIAGLTAFWVVLLSLSFAYAKDDEETTAHLGVYAEEVTSDIAADYGVQTGRGVLVEDVVSGSPADKAGLRSNDILVSLDGAALTGPAELRVQIAKHKPGDQVSITYFRGGKERTADIELEERESGMWFGESFEDGAHALHDKIKVMVDKEKGEDSDRGFAGVVTQGLGEGLQNYFKVESGALISEVVEDSPAEAAGLKAGDVIVRIGDHTVDDEDDVFKAIRKHKAGDEVDFEVMRDGKEMTFKVKLTERSDFYGSADDGSAYSFGYAVPDADIHAYHLDLEALDENLQDLDDNLDALDDIRMDLSIDPVPPVARFNFDGATSIEDRGWWKRNWNETKTRLEEEFEELKAGFRRLKEELKQLQVELKERMM